jgi:hypothetical protein
MRWPALGSPHATSAPGLTAPLAAERRAAAPEAALPAWRRLGARRRSFVCLFVCLQPFVSPALWERAGNVPPLVRLLQARPIYGPPVRRLAVGSRRAGVARQSQRRCGPSRVSTTSKLRADRNKQTNEHTNPSGAGRLDTLCVASRTGVPALK